MVMMMTSGTFAEFCKY